jgi:hypothetical protein
MSLTSLEAHQLLLALSGQRGVGGPLGRAPGGLAEAPQPAPRGRLTATASASLEFLPRVEFAC